MKKFFSLMIILLFAFTAMPTGVYAADDAAEGNVLTKMSDWAKTAGKDENEKKRILAERKAARQKKHMEKKAEKMKNKASNKGHDMKKKMGA